MRRSIAAAAGLGCLLGASLAFAHYVSPAPACRDEPPLASAARLGCARARARRDEPPLSPLTTAALTGSISQPFSVNEILILPLAGRITAKLGASLRTSSRTAEPSKSLNGLVRAVLTPIAARDHDRRTVSWLQLTSLRLATGRRASSSANTAAFASSRQSAPFTRWKGPSSAPLIRRREPRASASGPASRPAAFLSPDRRRSDAQEPATPPVVDARAGPPQRSAAMRSVPQALPNRK